MNMILSSRLNNGVSRLFTNQILGTIVPQHRGMGTFMIRINITHLRKR
jgi:hypothetical protein